MFGVSFFGYFKPHIRPTYILEIPYTISWTKCSLNWPKKHVEKFSFFFPNGAS